MAAASAIATRVVCAQIEPTFARLQTGNVIEILDLERAEWRPVYQSTYWSTSALSVSPEGERLAFLAWNKGVVVGHGYTKPPTSRLLVIDKEGRLYSIGVPDVQRYAWCGPSCVVYITGQYEESHVGFRPRGVGMLDLASGRRIAMPAPANPIGILWAAHDSNAYVKNRARVGEADIYRLNLTTRKLQPALLKDHFFSPTGRYYAHRPDLTDTLVIYDTRTNLPLDLSHLRGESIPLGWVSNREDVLLTLMRPRKQDSGESSRRPRFRARTRAEPVIATYRLYEMPTARLRESHTGQLDSWAAPGHLRLLRQGSKYRILGQE